MTRPLDAKTALITGGSRGIGRAIALRLARDGALVAVHFGKSEQAAEQTVATIKDAGGRAFLVQTTLGEPGDAEALWNVFDRALADHSDRPGLDILVNNAGTEATATLAQLTEDTFDRAVAVNARAPLFIIKHGLPRLRDGGRIINLSSGVTRMATPATLAYSMTKGAINTLTLTLAVELGPRNITVNAVAPGTTQTEMATWLNHPAARAQSAAFSVFNRLGQPTDIADVVAFLASDDARWVTGQIIDASGGSMLGVADTWSDAAAWSG
jgi:3-oxoacyl-[acyl-carrier protein] reductase